MGSILCITFINAMIFPSLYGQNIGIGISTPNYPLHVQTNNSASYADAAHFVNLGDGTGSYMNGVYGESNWNELFRDDPCHDQSHPGAATGDREASEEN